PGVVELKDAAIGGIAVLWNVGNVAQRLVQRDPDVAVASFRVERARPGVGDRLLERKLRDHHQLAVAVVLPAVIAANDVSVATPALGESCGAMAAAILQCRGFALGIEKQHDRLTEQRERLRPTLKLFEAHNRVPEAAKHRLLGCQHEVSPKIQAAMRVTTRAASDRSRARSRPGMAPSSTMVRPPISRWRTRAPPQVTGATRRSCMPKWRGWSRSNTAMSACWPGASVPTCGRPSTRAPPAVAQCTTFSAVTAFAPFTARWVCQALCISQTMSAASFDAAPSTPSDTAPPSAARASAGATPEPSRQFDCG